MRVPQSKLWDALLIRHEKERGRSRALLEGADKVDSVTPDLRAGAEALVVLLVLFVGLKPHAPS